jgi:polyhydroxyalkanoate synthesis repressor PhaR
VEDHVRTIKRYANRKLYDTSESRYVNLEEIADLVRAGEDVQIIDNTSKEDITGRTLAQIISEEEGRQDPSFNTGILQQMIRSSGDLLNRHVTRPVQQLRDGAEKTVATLREDLEEGVQRLRKREKEGAEQLRAGLRDVVESTQGKLDEAQRKIDDKIREIVSNLPLIRSQRDELRALRKRVEALEAALGLDNNE